MKKLLVIALLLAASLLAAPAVRAESFTWEESNDNPHYRGRFHAQTVCLDGLLLALVDKAGYDVTAVQLMEPGVNGGPAQPVLCGERAKAKSTSAPRPQGSKAVR